MTTSKHAPNVSCDAQVTSQERCKEIAQARNIVWDELTFIDREAFDKYHLDGWIRTDIPIAALVCLEEASDIFCETVFAMTVEDYENDPRKFPYLHLNPCNKWEIKIV